MSLADKLAQVGRLEAELDALLCDAGVADLKAENAKLAYQINQLKKAIVEERAQIKPPVVIINQSIFDSLQSIFSFAIQTAFPDLLAPQAKLNVVAEKMEKFGDYMCVSTMDIAKMYKEQGVNKNPREIAQKIVDSIPENEIIESTNIAGPGFINAVINKKYLLKQISSIYQNDVQAKGRIVK